MNIKNIITILISKVRLKFGFSFDETKIPEGLYCYSPKKFPSKETNWVYEITPCKYFKPITKSYNGCQFLGVITEDPFFDDQCKICGENYGEMEE